LALVALEGLEQVTPFGIWEFFLSYCNSSFWTIWLWMAPVTGKNQYPIEALLV
jgi:hypothetical protein